MAARRTTFGKIQRDRDKKAKASAKRDRRLERAEAGAEDDDTSSTGDARDTVNESEVIERLERLHQRFDDGDIDFDDFEKEKAALLARLT